MIRQGGGSIINTASMSAHITNIPQKECSYAASKAGVIAMSRNMAVEWADKNVRVNTISPGYMATEMTLNDPGLVPLIGKWEELIPVHRMGKPEELQAIAVYLAGDMSSYTTGADFRVCLLYTSRNTGGTLSGRVSIIWFIWENDTSFRNVFRYHSKLKPPLSHTGSNT